MFPEPDAAAMTTAPISLIRAAKLALVGLVLAVVPMAAGSAVLAQDDESNEAFAGTLFYADPETNDRVFLEGVAISVVDGETATSDEDGRWRLPVPEPGEYTLTVDVDSLPEEVSLRDPERSSVTVRVNPDTEQVVAFAIVAGEGGIGPSSGAISFRRISQLTAEGLKQGLYLAMAAIGLSLIFGTTGLTNFAHAELVTWGMLSTYFFNVYGLAGLIGFLAPLPPPFGGGVDLVFAAILGVFAGGLMGYVINRFIFKGARRAGVSLLAQMLMTIGLSILMRYVFLYFFRGGPRTFGQYTAQRAVKIGPIELTPKDMIAMALSVVILIGVGLYLQRTKMGKAMRAVADNRELAESTGIDVERVISTVWVSGASLAALGGVFFGLTQIRWDSGFRILLLIFASVVLGGLGTAFGALVGAIVVGLAINLSTLVIDAELKNMVALLVMVVILMVRPQGILGRPERVG
jgi:neutral amino acid transport system permease protein